ncbi:MAG TPA: FUSC family protein [Amnibacterium sp.]
MSGVLRGVAAALLRPSASPPRLAVATQAAVAMALAVGVPALLGRTDLGLLASAGALTALYLASRARRERARRLPVLQAGFLAAAVVGAATGGSPFAPLVLALLTVIAAALVLGFSVGPPGAVFFVLVAGVTGRLTAPSSSGGVGLDARLVLGMEALGCLLAYAIAVLPLAIPGVRRRDAALPVAPVRFVLDATTRVVLIRIAIGAGIAAGLGGLLGLHRTYWVLLAVVAALQAGRSRRMTALRGVHRALGTLVGVGAFALLALVPLPGVALALVVAALQFVTELVVVRHYGLALVFITPLALTIAEAGSTGPLPALILDRIVDTSVGAAVAVAVLVVDLAVERVAARV